MAFRPYVTLARRVAAGGRRGLLDASAAPSASTICPQAAQVAQFVPGTRSYASTPPRRAAAAALAYDYYDDDDDHDAHDAGDDHHDHGHEDHDDTSGSGGQSGGTSGIFGHLGPAGADKKDGGIESDDLRLPTVRARWDWAEIEAMEEARRLLQSEQGRDRLAEVAPDLVRPVELLDGDTARQFLQEYAKYHTEEDGSPRYSRNPAMRQWQAKLVQAGQAGGDPAMAARATAAASVLAPHELIDAHCAFIKAGADVITTFTGGLTLQHEAELLDMCKGVTSDLNTLVEEAVACALEARESCGRRDVRIAAELPTQGGGLFGGDTTAAAAAAVADVQQQLAMRDAYGRLADRLAPFVELFSCGSQSQPQSLHETGAAVTAAARTGRPVFVTLDAGIADPNGSLLFAGGKEVETDRAVDYLMDAAARSGGVGRIDGWILRSGTNTASGLPALAAAAETGRIGAMLTSSSFSSSGSSFSGDSVSDEVEANNGDASQYQDDALALRRAGVEIIAGGDGVLADDVRSLYALRAERAI